MSLLSLRETALNYLKEDVDSLLDILRRHKLFMQSDLENCLVESIGDLTIPQAILLYTKEKNLYVRELIYSGIKKIAHEGFSSYLTFPFSTTIKLQFIPKENLTGRLNRQIVEALLKLERERVVECCTIIAERRGLVCIEKDTQVIWNNFPICKEIVVRSLFNKVLETVRPFEFGIIFQYDNYGNKNIIPFFMEEGPTLELLHREMRYQVTLSIIYSDKDFNEEERNLLWRAALTDQIQIVFGASYYTIWVRGYCFLTRKILIDPEEIGRAHVCYPKFSGPIEFLRKQLI
ncbi:MAG: hypothetical protein Solivirus2_34 [Solivirus sp.]|uniref:Uncharacterized protein n=1 Tax=Solivirus sp. TaxID=2487772 RepID=A0A3G5AJD9_9VIRU|nr:MAG: hypothetical protein Solivirus2_34 [Solivirus sp.]